MGPALASSGSVNINAAGHVDLQGCDRSTVWDGRGDGAPMAQAGGREKMQPCREVPPAWWIPRSCAAIWGPARSSASNRRAGNSASLVLTVQPVTPRGRSHPSSGTVGRLLVDAEGIVTWVPTWTLAKSRLPRKAGDGGGAPRRGRGPPSRVRAGLRHAVSLVKLLTARGGLCVISGGWFLYNYNTPFSSSSRE